MKANWVALLVAGVSASAALAADCYWTGADAGNNNLWSNPLNWSDNTPPAGNADVAVFPAGTPPSVLVDASTSIRCIYCRNPGMTLTVAAGQLLSFENAGATTIRADEDATIEGPGTLIFSAGNGEDWADNQVVPGRTLTISAPITGEKGFEHNGVGGTIVLNNPGNDYEGVTYLSGGGGISIPSVVANTGVASPLGKHGMFQFRVAPSFLRYTGGAAATDLVIVQQAGGGTEATVEHAGTGILTLTGEVRGGNNNALSFAFDIADPSAAIDFAGTYSDGGGGGTLGLRKRGAGAVRFSSASAHSGDTLLQDGSLEVAPSGSFSAASLLRMGGGNLLFNAGTPDAGAYTATLGTVQVEGGANVIAIAPGAATATLTVASFTHTAGTVDFKADGLGGSSKIFLLNQPDGLMGPWVTVGDGAFLAAYDSSIGVHAAVLPTQSLAARGPSAITNDAATQARITSTGTGGGISLADAPTEVMLLSQDVNTPAAIAFGGYTLVTPIVQITPGGAGLTLGNAPGDGTLLPPASSGNRLILRNADAPGGAALTVNAGISDGGAAPASLDKISSGDVVLAGPVTHTGGTMIGAGMLTVSNDAAMTWPAGGISGNGGFTKTGAGTLYFPNAANSYNGTTRIKQGIVSILSGDTFGNKTGPTVVEDGAAIDLPGTDNNNLWFHGEEIVARGAGPDGLGALRNTGPFFQVNAIRLLTLTDDLTVYAPSRFDVRDAGGTASVNLNGHGITKKGGNYFGLVNAALMNDQGTSFIDVEEGCLHPALGVTFSGGADNAVTIRDGASMNIYEVYAPINWSLNLDGSAHVATSQGYGTGVNTWAGPVKLNGTATFESIGTVCDTFSGAISGDGTLVKTGNDNGITYLLSTGNTWGGGTTVSGGILYALDTSSLPGYASTVSVLNKGTLAVRVADEPKTQPGFSLAQINAILGYAFQSSSASIGFDTAYEDLDYSTRFQHIGVTKLGPNKLTLSGVGPDLGPVCVLGGTLDLSSAQTYLGDNNVTIGQSASPANPLPTLILGTDAEINTMDKGSGNNTQPIVFVGDSGRGVMHVSGNAKVSGRLIVGHGGAAAGAVYQTGGTVHNTGGVNADGYIGANGYGYYLLAGGLFENNGYSQVGVNGNAVGILHQTGGEFLFNNTYGGNFSFSRGGQGLAYLEGGEFHVRNALWISDEHGGDNGYACVTVTGNAQLFINGSIGMGLRGGSTSILNLNGGEVNAQHVNRANRGASAVNLNWDGGLFRPTNSGALFDGEAPGLYADITLYGRGAVIEIPDNSKNKTASAPMRAPEKLSLLEIPLLSRGAGYLGPPFVRIQGGGGTGATAFAHVLDGEVTEIEITSPGTGYTSAPTVTLLGGGASAAATPGQPLVGKAAPGGLTKLGAGKLTLNAANTYAGPTEIREGILRLTHPDALPPYTAVSVTGGILDLGGNTLTNAAISATGGSIINGYVATGTIAKDDGGTLTLSAPLTPGPAAPPSRPLTPGLWEGMIRENWDTSTPNPMQGIQPTTRAANGGSQANNYNYAGGLWRDNNHTWVYSGYIWNNEARDVDWTFFGRFDDNMSLTIDGFSLFDISNDSDEFTTYTLTPGPHTFEARFGDGNGDVGPGPQNRAIVPTNGPMSGLLVDYSGSAPSFVDGLIDLTNFQILEDPGDGSLFTLDTPEPPPAAPPAGPGLLESMIRSSWAPDGEGRLISRQLTTRAANGEKALNGTYAGGLWAGNNHTWIYKGYLWNRGDHPVTWTWRFTFDDDVSLAIDDELVRYVTLSEGIQYANTTLDPGPHKIEIRFGDGVGEAGPDLWLGNGPERGLSGLAYTANVGSEDLYDYTRLEDDGTGCLLTTHEDWKPGTPGPAPEPAPPIVNVNAGTLLMGRNTSTAGLCEGRLDGQFNTEDDNPCTDIELTTTAANGGCGEGGYISGKHWPDNSTYVYTGYIWNRDPTNVFWTFAENFDDCVRLTIRGETVLDDWQGESWSRPTLGTIELAPGAHAFEVRFGQGGGGAGANSAGWWDRTDMAFGIDFQGRHEAVMGNYEIPWDPGDGSLFTWTLDEPPQEEILGQARVNLGAAAVLDLDGRAHQIGMVAGTGTVSNGTLSAGTVISPAGDDAIGTLTFDNVTLAPGVTYRLTIDGPLSDCLIFTGPADMSGVTIIPAAEDAPLTAPRYVIAQAAGGYLPSASGVIKPTVAGFPRKYQVIRQGPSLLLTSQGGTLMILR